MSKVVDFGKVQIFKSDPFDWSNDRTFVKLELVAYNGFVYLCIQDTLTEGILPTNEDYFIQLGLDKEYSQEVLAHLKDKTSNPHNVTNINGTAAKLAKAVNINLTGDTTGTTSFDGSKSVNIATTTTVWNGSHKFISASAPTASQGVVNDIWFQY